MEPIACKLAPSDLAVRETEIRSLGRDALAAVESRSPRHVVLRFHDDPEVHRRVAALVAAESECCAFLGFVHEGARLAVSAPEGGEEVLAGLADAFAAS